MDVLDKARILQPRPSMKTIAFVVLPALLVGCAHHDTMSDPNTTMAVTQSYDPTAGPGTNGPTTEPGPAPAPYGPPPTGATLTMPPAAQALPQTNGSAPSAEAPSSVGASPTRDPSDQGTSPNDLKITTTIHKSLVSDTTLSVTAQGVTVTTNGGKVVLRGTVKTPKERADIETKARAVPGVIDVDNQLQLQP